MEEKDKVTPEIYEEERSDRVVRLEVHRGGREEPEPMVPLSVIHPLMEKLGERFKHGRNEQDLPLALLYDEVAKTTGHPALRELLSDGIRARSPVPSRATSPGRPPRS